MPNPVLAFVGSGVGTSLTSIFNPVTLAAGYGANYATPIALPDLGEMIGTFAQGSINVDSLVDQAKFHCRQFTEPQKAFTYTRWDTTLNAAMLNDQCEGLSMNDVSLVNYKYMPSIDEANQLYNRGLIERSLQRYIINRQTYRNPALTNAWMEMRFEIPGPSDLVRFAVRDCFTPEIVNTFEYAKETPTQIKSWMDKQGYGQDIGLAIPANATDSDNNPISGSATWFDLYWWSHWELPSPQQGYEMLHKLYPASRFGPSPLFNGTNGFTDEQMRLLLKTQDYPAFWRDRLIATSYHTLNRSDVMPMYERGLVDRATVYHALRADGYNDTNAMALLALADYNKAKYIGIDIQKHTKEWVCKYYQEGMITRENAVARLTSIGITIPIANAFLDNCDEEIFFKTRQERTKLIKMSFVRGIFSRNQARDNLRVIIKNETRVSALLANWEMQRNLRYKDVMTSKNVSAYEKGLIDRTELIARLQNLQYSDKAISTMVNLADYQINQTRLKILQRQLIEQNKAAKEELKRQAANRKEEARKASKRVNNLEKFNNRRIHAIVKASSDKNIIEWYKKELIELWEVFYRLYYKDFTMNDAMRWVRNKLPDIEEEELRNAETKAAKVYRSEPNPPLNRGS